MAQLSTDAFHLKGSLLSFAAQGKRAHSNRNRRWTSAQRQALPRQVDQRSVSMATRSTHQRHSLCTPDSGMFRFAGNVRRFKGRPLPFALLSRKSLRRVCPRMESALRVWLVAVRWERVVRLPAGIRKGRGDTVTPSPPAFSKAEKGGGER